MELFQTWLGGKGPSHSHPHHGQGYLPPDQISFSKCGGISVCLKQLLLTPHFGSLCSVLVFSQFCFSWLVPDSRCVPGFLAHREFSVIFLCLIHHPGSWRPPKPFAGAAALGFEAGGELVQGEQESSSFPGKT